MVNDIDNLAEVRIFNVPFNLEMYVENYACELRGLRTIAKAEKFWKFYLVINVCHVHFNSCMHWLIIVYFKTFAYYLEIETLFKNVKNDDCRFLDLSSKDIIVKIVLRNIDLLFQGHILLSYDILICWELD